MLARKLLLTGSSLLLFWPGTATAQSPRGTVYGGRGAVRVRALLPEERDWMLRLVARPRAVGDGGGGNFSGFETTQTLYEAPEVGEASAEGNAVLLVWDEDGTVPGNVTVVIDGLPICTVPALPAPGRNSCLVTGLAPNCTPESEFDPVCPSNLPPGCDPDGVLAGNPHNVYFIEIVASDGSSSFQCQQVFSTWPFAARPFLGYRLEPDEPLLKDLLDPNCQRTFEKSSVLCPFTTTDGDCDIIITGGNSGPPPSYIDVFVDGTLALHAVEIEDRICFDKPVSVSTRGSHEVRFTGFLDREQAAGSFWFDPDTFELVTAGTVGNFIGLDLRSQCAETACGVAAGGLLPGDLNLDGAVDLSDAVNLLGHLFQAKPARLPCTGGTINDPGTRALADWNGDGAVDLSDAVGELGHLFQGQPAHVLGRGCRAIAQCPDACP
jgi:hypothetical protein